MDYKTIDAIITGTILLSAVAGAMLAYSAEERPIHKAGAFAYLAIAATVGPVFAARVLGPGGLGYISLDTQIVLLAFGHAFALVLVLTLLIVTVRRVRRKTEGDLHGMD